MDLNEIYYKIKEMSERMVNPRPMIPIVSLAAELVLAREQVLPYLIELKRLHLIRFENPTAAYINLTLLGYNVSR